jgi:DNA-binding IclR family transcriptional regulator
MNATACLFIARTMHALELLADAPRSTAEIADALMIQPRTARRMLSRLVDEGYVDHRPHARPAYTLATGLEPAAAGTTTRDAILRAVGRSRNARSLGAHVVIYRPRQIGRA